MAGYSIDRSGGNESFGQVGSTSGQYGGPSGSMSRDGGGDDGVPVGDMTGGTKTFGGRSTAYGPGGGRALVDFVKSFLPKAPKVPTVKAPKTPVKLHPQDPRANNRWTARLPQPRYTIDLEQPNPGNPLRDPRHQHTPHIPNPGLVPPRNQPGGVREAPGGLGQRVIRDASYTKPRGGGGGGGSGNQHGNFRPGGRPKPAIQVRGAAGSGKGMTESQKRQAGIYHNQAGQRVTAKKVTENAVNRLIAGQKLTKNQNHAVGTAMRNMNQTQRRNFGNQLALASRPGQNVNVVKPKFNKPLGNAMKVAKQVKKNARRR